MTGRWRQTPGSPFRRRSSELRRSLQKPGTDRVVETGPRLLRLSHPGGATRMSAFCDPVPTHPSLRQNLGERGSHILSHSSALAPQNHNAGKTGHLLPAISCFFDTLKKLTYRKLTTYAEFCSTALTPWDPHPPFAKNLQTRTLWKLTFAENKPLTSASSRHSDTLQFRQCPHPGLSAFGLSPYSGYAGRSPVWERNFRLVWIAGTTGPLSPSSMIEALRGGTGGKVRRAN